MSWARQTGFRANALVVLAITAAAGASGFLVNGCSSTAQDPQDPPADVAEHIGVVSAALNNLGVPGEAIDDSVMTPQPAAVRYGFLSWHLTTGGGGVDDPFTDYFGNLVASGTNCTSFTGLTKGSCNGIYEAQTYYYPKLMGVATPYGGALSSLPLATLAQFKAWGGIPAQNVGETLDAYRARTNTLIYYNYTGLQLGRELACGHFTDTNGQQGTACFVSNYGQQFGDEPNGTADAVAGIRRKNTVSISYRPALPANEQVNFYVYDRNDNLVPYASLDDHGDRSVPQICTTCHGGVYTAADHLAANARFLPPDPYVLHFPASGTYTQANQLPVVRNINNMIYTDSFIAGSSILNQAQQLEVQTLYGLAPSATTIPGNAQSANNVPVGWNNTTAQADLYKQVVKPLCQVCHSAVGVAATSSWANATAAAGTIKLSVCDNVIGAFGSGPQIRMPQSAAGMKALWADPVTVGGVNYANGKNALMTALGYNPATMCALTSANTPGCYVGSRDGSDSACGARTTSEQNPAYGNGKYCNLTKGVDGNGASISGIGMCMDGCDPTGQTDINVKCHVGEQCQWYPLNDLNGRCVKCGGVGQPDCAVAGGFQGGGSNGGSGATCLASYTFPTVAGNTYTIADPYCTGDSYVKVSGSCTCANDDFGGSLCSSCTCTASSTGTATICASTFSTASSSWTYNVTGPKDHGACGSLYPVGEYATWQGVVNVHRAVATPWAVDNDCSSGAENNTVAYCQKYWPQSTAQVAIAVSSESKPFTNGTGSQPLCGGAHYGVGHNQFACCAP